MFGYFWWNAVVMEFKSLRWSGAAEKVKYVRVTGPDGAFDPPAQAVSIAAATVPMVAVRNRRFMIDLLPPHKFEWSRGSRSSRVYLSRTSRSQDPLIL